MNDLPITGTAVPHAIHLRRLPLAARLTLALFLLSVGLGYLSALVNLHFAEAPPGKSLPDDNDVVTDFHGKAGVSQFERLLEANPSLPRNGSGSMRRYLTREGITSGAWKALVKRKAKKMKAPAAEIDKAVARGVEGERRVLIAWARAGAPQDPYENDSFPLTGQLASLEITDQFVEEGEKGERSAKIKSILDVRCARCHSESVGGPAAQYPLENYEQIHLYTDAEEPTGRSLSQLAQTTHVHLLGFSMLYGLTGLVLAFSSYPRWLRVLLCPLPLLAQVVDISFWWLARLDAPYGPQFASAIIYSGGVVAMGLGLHILLSLFDLFGKTGKLVLLVFAVLTLGSGFLVKERVIDPYLLHERIMHEQDSGQSSGQETPADK